MKICASPSCQHKRPQPTTNFGKLKSRKDGLYPYCKDCVREKNNIRNTANRETLLARRKEQYASNPGPQKARTKQWKLENPEYNKNWFKQQQKPCAVPSCTAHVGYQQTMCPSHAQRHRYHPHLSLEELATFEPPNWERVKLRKWARQIYVRDNFQCQICSNNRSLNAHHIKPKASNPDLAFSIENGITLCSTCHKRVHEGKLAWPLSPTLKK